MNRNAVVLVMLAATGAAVPGRAAPDASARPDLDRVVRLWAAATGGLDHIRALRAVRMSGRITLGGEPHAFSVEIARPGRIRTEVTFPQGVWIQVFDGKHGWTVSPLEKGPAPTPMTAEQEKNAPEQADIEGPLVDSAKKGIRLALEGKEMVDGRDAWRIRVTRGDGVVRYLDLDAATSQKVRWQGELGEGGERRMNASLFSDYRTVGGLSFPFRIVSGAAGEEPSQEIVFEKIEVNPAISDSAFARPK
jgi:hypothetical protein